MNVSEVENDSKMLVHMVSNNCKINGVIPSLIRHVQELLRRDWHTQVIHTWCEDNICADWLANFSFSLDSRNLLVFETHSSELRRFLFDDILSGACMPKNVHLAS
jgi:hypothetical protein